jgi:hypothetical protein
MLLYLAIFLPLRAVMFSEYQIDCQESDSKCVWTAVEFPSVS